MAGAARNPAFEQRHRQRVLFLELVATGSNTRDFIRRPRSAFPISEAPGDAQDDAGNWLNATCNYRCFRGRLHNRTACDVVEVPVWLRVAAVAVGELEAKDA